MQPYDPARDAREAQARIDVLERESAAARRAAFEAEAGAEETNRDLRAQLVQATTRIAELERDLAASNLRIGEDRSEVLYRTIVWDDQALAVLQLGEVPEGVRAVVRLRRNFSIDDINALRIFANHCANGGSWVDWRDAGWRRLAAPRPAASDLEAVDVEIDDAEGDPVAATAEAATTTPARGRTRR